MSHDFGAMFEHLNSRKRASKAIALTVLRSPKPTTQFAFFKPIPHEELVQAILARRLGLAAPAAPPEAPSPATLAWGLTVLGLVFAVTAGGWWYAAIVVGLWLDWYRTEARKRRYQTDTEAHVLALAAHDASRQVYDQALLAEQHARPVDPADVNQLHVEIYQEAYAKRQDHLWHPQVLRQLCLAPEQREVVTENRYAGYVTELEDELAAELVKLLPVYQQVVVNPFGSHRPYCARYTADMLVSNPVSGELWVVEVDGSHHHHDPQLQKDLEREAALNARGLHVIRIDNSGVTGQASRAAAAIATVIAGKSGLPVPEKVQALQGRRGELAVVEARAFIAVPEFATATTETTAPKRGMFSNLLVKLGILVPAGTESWVERDLAKIEASKVAFENVRKGAVTRASGAEEPIAID